MARSCRDGTATVDIFDPAGRPVVTFSHTPRFTRITLEAFD